MAQVTIVGAGPTGATLALLLVKRGISVHLIEASRSFQRVFRGEGLMPSGLAALAEMGLTTMVEQLPHRALTAWEVVINRRLLFRVEEPIEAGGQPCTLVSQPALLEALIAAASAYPQFELLAPTTVQDLLWQEQRVVGVRLGDGREVYSDLVIAADGRHSGLRQRAHLQLCQSSAPFDILWFKLADRPEMAADNVFSSIVQGRQSFGVFRSAESHLQIGWFWHPERSPDWKQVDWAKTLAEASPDWLAQHIQTQAHTLERPVLLSVVVGYCPQWSVPGLLLLGDAAHPMSPVRAQGINMALRDVIVAANHLVPLLQEKAATAAIDGVLPAIQAARQPEILRMQRLQAAEAGQAELLAKSEVLPWAVSRFAPLLGFPIRQSWVRRQRQLRQGVAPLRLTV